MSGERPACGNMGGAQWNVTPSDAVQQESLSVRTRWIKFIGIMLFVGLGLFFIINRMLAAGADLSVTPTAVPVILATSTAVPVVVPTFVPVPTLIVNRCRAIVDGDGYVSSSVYTVQGWSQAVGGQLFLNGIGWRPLAHFSCFGLGALPELSYSVATKAPATSTPVPSVTPSPSRTPVPWVPPAPATSTPSPVPLTFRCSASPYLVNASGVSLAVVAIGTDWSTTLAAGAVLWLNPVGAQKWIVSGSGRSVRIEFTPVCPGGSVTP
ncbi:hypothetical protein CCP3SC15_1720003 [Gammaproteobacteria bacterium]